MKLRNLIITAAVLGLAACGGNEDKTDHAAMGHDPSAATAFAASEAAMHTDMAAATGATLDEAYIAKMTAHHRGAIAMADVALAQSKDPHILRMAQAVKDAQTVEIAEMEAWEPAPAGTVPVATAPAPAAPAEKSAAPTEPAAN